MQLPDITIIAVTLLAVTIPVFIFAVTLLGNAIERASQEEKKTKEEQQKVFTVQINDLEHKIKALKDSGDSSQFDIQVKNLKKLQKVQKKQLGQIRTKYSALEFKHSILIPGGLFFISAFLSEISKPIMSSTYSYIVLWVLSAIALILGILKLSRSLILAQDISRTSDELQMKKMTESFKAAIVAVNQESEVALSITFTNISGSQTYKPSTELSINFYLDITKGKIANNVETWFFMPDEFGLVSPPEEDAWRQGADFILPHIRTIKKELGKVRFGTRFPSYIKIKAPAVSGKYLISYRIYSDEYKSVRGQIELIVKE